MYQTQKLLNSYFREIRVQSKAQYDTSSDNCLPCWLSEKKQDESNYDEIEDIPNQPTVLNNQKDSSGLQPDLSSVIENPYYGGEDELNIDDIATNVNVLDNPYYGELDGDGDEDNINVMENPYYGGVDDIISVEEDQQ